VLRVLAAEPAEQEQAYTPFCAVDEMISEFSHWSDVWLGNYGVAGSAGQCESLEAVDAEIGRLSEADRDCSSPEPLGSPGWAKVRVASQAALTAFDWSTRPLPRQIPVDGVYHEECE